MADHSAVPPPDDIVESVGVSFVKQASVTGKQMKFPWRTTRSVRRGIIKRAERRRAIDLVVGRRSIATRSARRRPAVTRRSVGAHCVVQFGDTAAQFVVSAAKLF